MKAKIKSEDDSVKQMLKRAREFSEKEQEGYVKIIEAIRQSQNEGELSDPIKLNGLKGLYKVMKGYTYPPSHEDRRSFLNVEDGQFFVHSSLRKISDEGIRTYMFFLNETIEQTQRLRAMARFSKCVSPVKGVGEQLFRYWKKKPILEILTQEAGKLGKAEEKEMLVKFSAGVDLIISVQLDAWPTGLDLSPLKGLNACDSN